MEPRREQKEDGERRLRRRCSRESLRGEPAWERCREDVELYEWCVSRGESGPLKNYSSATHERYASVVSPDRSFWRNYGRVALVCSRAIIPKGVQPRVVRSLSSSSFHAPAMALRSPMAARSLSFPPSLPFFLSTSFRISLRSVPPGLLRRGSGVLGPLPKLDPLRASSTIPPRSSALPRAPPALRPRSAPGAEPPVVVGADDQGDVPAYLSSFFLSLFFFRFSFRNL